MTLVNCTKSKYHGLYDTTKNLTCPWCDTPNLKSSNKINSAATNKKKSEMTEDEILEAKIIFASKKILQQTSFGEKIRVVGDYKRILKNIGVDLDLEFEKENP